MAGTRQAGYLQRFDTEGVALPDRLAQGSGARRSYPQRTAERPHAGRSHRSEGGQVLLHLGLEQRHHALVLQQCADHAQHEGDGCRRGRGGCRRRAARLQDHQAPVQRADQVRAGIARGTCFRQPKRMAPPSSLLSAAVEFAARFAFFRNLT